MLNREYIPFQYVVVYIAVLQGGMGAGQWLSYGPSKFACTHRFPYRHI
jgi:ATP-binding cassette subfamily B (MDR/TAP) protein 1